MLTSEKIIREIYLLPLSEREKIAHHIVHFGIKNMPPDMPEILDLDEWQEEIAREPFNLTQASDYLGVSAATVKKWAESGRILFHKVGRTYRFDVRDLKKFKKSLKNGNP
ncbi:helix-turn-helix domain-containing protein [Desulfonema magnum]|uniref:DNA binding domain-containing protein n=1 Tax=Desulfonema magnum TaxID=45655 RepID=A0A975BHU7_9BACT|nr:helix-turn-helix domain-containing protein [Desulfonema magnum]QTA85568.1 DNA binding domain-containing protein [Desulfonema magnum]